MEWKSSGLDVAASTWWGGICSEVWNPPLAVTAGPIPSRHL